MKKAHQDTEFDDWIIRGFISACVIGVVAMVAAEYVVTGEDVLEAGVSWQSWVAAGVAALITFAGFLAWGLRKVSASDPARADCAKRIAVSFRHD